MPIYVVDHREGPPAASYERSPLVAVETDAASADALPHAIRSLADSISCERLDAFQGDRVPRDSTGALTWIEGDRLLEGSPAMIRRDLRKPGRRCFVPVHLPCIPDLDLLALEPRWLSGGQMADFWSAAARISRTTSPSARSLEALRTIQKPWAQMLQALLAEQAKAGAGIEELARVANDGAAPTQVGALALRNLIIALMKQNDLAKAEQVLEGAFKAFPTNTELLYVGAMLCLRARKTQKALGYLERTRTGNHDFVGSGGESSYRSAWLLGKMAAEVGNQKVAFENFYQGMVSRPVFGPAVDELLNLRLSPALAERYEYDFCKLVRRAPKYLNSVFGYLLLHRAFRTARRIAETTGLKKEQKEALLAQLASAEAPFVRRTGDHGGKPGILFSGPFFENTSFGRINRELAAGLMQRSGFDVALEPCCHPAMAPGKFPCGPALSKAMLRHPKQLDLTIRHMWPPDFERPPRGKLAVILPWEYGTVPRTWVRDIERNVDELWVPSDFVRNVFVRAGVGESRVHVVPNGIDPKVFSPEGPTARPNGCRKFLFLFVGGAILRKGIDVLLEAYGEAFEAGDDVTLLINAGLNPAYAHNAQTGLLNQFIKDPGRPHLAALAEHFDDATLATLYRGCDAMVLPYRGEGFGMPIAEAMACGKPVITTGAGPAPEFCPSDCGYFIPAKSAKVPDAPPAFGALAGDWTWFAPDVAALARTMRHVYEHGDEAAERGRKAAKAIRNTHTWDRVVSTYVARIAQLTERDPAREAMAEPKEEGACRESLSA